MKEFHAKKGSKAIFDFKNGDPLATSKVADMHKDKGAKLAFNGATADQQVGVTNEFLKGSQSRLTDAKGLNNIATAMDNHFDTLDDHFKAVDREFTGLQNLRILGRELNAKSGSRVNFDFSHGNPLLGNKMKLMHKEKGAELNFKHATPKQQLAVTNRFLHGSQHQLDRAQGHGFDATMKALDDHFDTMDDHFKAVDRQFEKKVLLIL